MLSQSRIDFALELLDGVGELTTRKMLGGMGKYQGGQIFAIIMSDEKILLKGQGAMQDRFEELGMERWTYQRPGKKLTSMLYWTLSDEMLDDPEGASELAIE